MFSPARPARPVVEALERRTLYSAAATASPASPGAAGWAVEAAAPVPLFEAEGASVNGKLYVFGGFDNSKIQVTDEAEVYDPATNAWSALANTPAPQTHVGTATDGRMIYFAGGFRGNWYGQASTDFREYDTTTGAWSSGPSLPAPRGAGGLVLLGRQLHFFGGAYGPDPDHVSDAGDHWVLDLDNPSAGWVARAPLPDPRNHLGYAALNGKVYAIGGQHQLNESHGLDATVSVYDPATDSWSSAAPLPEPRSHVHNSTIVYDGRIICAGGTDTGDVASDQVLAYDPSANAWSVVGSLPAARSAAVAQVVGNELVVATGTPTGVLPQTTTWARPLDFLQPPAPAAAPAPGAPAVAGDLTFTVTTPAPAAVVLPATGGRAARGSTTVRIDNGGKGRFAGAVTVNLYLSPQPSADPAADPSAVRVAAPARRLSLAPGRGKSLRVAFAYPTDLPAGQYYMIAQASAAGSSASAVAVSPAAVTAAAAVSQVSAAFATPLPATLPPGGKVTAALALTNAGNVPADGPLRIAVSVVPASAADGPAGATQVLTVTRRAVIPPGKSRMLKLRLTLPRTLGVGAWSLTATVASAEATGRTLAPGAVDVSSAFHVLPGGATAV